MARLKDHYKSEVVPAMMKQFGYRNTMQVPRLEKIIVNMGLGEAIQNVKILESASAEIGALTGQKPVITKARKSIATFKLRKGMSVGCMVTLRKERMYEFFDRLVNVAIPRIRDFRGIPPSSFDGRGNFAMGIKEQFIFPEIDYDKIDKVKGMNVVIVTTARTDEEARHLLKLMGMPFRN
ncbi:MAG: 50S ribosomal protein L5 [Pseudomonadota bacterium]|jgi:large subunit ribosomal protein L5|nr:50S ribosomal protein L5 [Syntrophaceae bacterium]MDI9555313.1 50S ribosomal protein L5 [Pseudomonadota bacterium]NLX31804.1 50S ribosomal protein L5 [Deltaproteobacteria bacterium]HNU84355.1 50S ribosomal protein L5 [Syntrophales bacterium]HNZ34570.1 50S ribosomal protein L5 [Syntrophales bacterium]